MPDLDFWKRGYKGLWDKASARETNLQKIIEESTDKTLKPTGLGTGKSDFLSGSAESQGFEKGEADYEVENTNIQLEITGPLTPRVRPGSGLWIRSDKIENARNHEEKETWLIHHLPYNNLVRVIKFDDDFFTRYDAGQFEIVKPTIRGVVETYCEIRADDPCVQPFDTLLDRLKSISE